MGTYSKIVSTVKPINSIRTFIGGVAKDITSAWTFVNGVRKQVFPTTETWTLVYSNYTPGSYSTSLGFGKYMIVVSGGGGSGAAVARNHTSYVTVNNIQSGTNAQSITTYLNVSFGVTKTISGTIGAGGSASYARADDGHDAATAGTGGTGYVSGGNGGAKSDRYNISLGNVCSYGIASGAGGGSTSLLFDGVLNSVAAGGNGGSCKITAQNSGSHSRSGGIGGSGGASGSGAAGGAYNQIYAGSGYSGAGSNGYIQIYKSSIYPN